MDSSWHNICLTLWAAPSWMVRARTMDGRDRLPYLTLLPLWLLQGPGCWGPSCPVQLNFFHCYKKSK